MDLNITNKHVPNKYRETFFLQVYCERKYFKKVATKCNVQYLLNEIFVLARSQQQTHKIMSKNLYRHTNVAILTVFGSVCWLVGRVHGFG